jgi:AAA family ATPase
MGIRAPKGVLLYGPPGCSKTLIAKALATESKMNFLAVKGPELLSKWVGESERAVQSLFKRAANVSPCVIFFDEIDALTSKRGEDSGGGVSDRVLSQLLTEIDGIQPLHRIVIVAATNRPDVMDPALLRPGRMDRVLLIGLPDDTARRDIFRIQLRRMPHDDTIDVKILVEKSAGYTGAEVVAVCKEAAMHAVERDRNVEALNIGDFLHALAFVSPQVTKEVMDFYENWKP